MRYLIDSKAAVADAADLQWDVFVSAYNSSDRVKSVFAAVVAETKQWWVLPEYRYDPSELEGVEDLVWLGGQSEAEILGDVAESIAELARNGKSLCVDLTGFMRSHILFLLKFLRDKNVLAFDTLYTEPDHYSKKADTTFSERFAMVRTVDGYGGQHEPGEENDVLIMGVGYDDGPMAQVISNKDNARLVQLHSLPSLSADMYHESLLRLDRVAGVSSRPVDGEIYFASANDPYVTAETLLTAVNEIASRRPITNLYLCPLATKVQALGFALFYLSDLEGTASSVILPVIESYSKETSTGVGRTWIYPINFS